MLGAKEIAVLEAVPAEQSRFWEYVGRHEHVKYHQVADLSCSVLPDDHFNFFFTYGCFCHLPPDAIEEYMTNVFAKLRRGTHGFMMVGDFSKYNRAIENLAELGDTRACNGRRFAPVRWLWEAIWKTAPQDNLKPIEARPLDEPNQVSWHDTGIDGACEILQRAGYVILDRDCGVNHRDPVIHFLRP